jgi:hypothetical protein
MIVEFTGCSDTQATWGKSEDPRQYLTLGEKYVIDKVEVHSCYTLYCIGEHKFNSVCFREIKP